MKIEEDCVVTDSVFEYLYSYLINHTDYYPLFLSVSFTHDVAVGCTHFNEKSNYIKQKVKSNFC
jgi:hypothetical protein